MPESVFRRAIVDNYYSTNSTQFSFELDAEQVARLCELFKQFSTNRNTPSRNQITPGGSIDARIASWDGTQPFKLNANSPLPPTMPDLNVNFN